MLKISKLEGRTFTDVPNPAVIQVIHDREALITLGKYKKEWEGVMAQNGLRALIS
jgi:hypothetical protein